MADVVTRSADAVPLTVPDRPWRSQRDPAIQLMLTPSTTNWSAQEEECETAQIAMQTTPASHWPVTVALWVLIGGLWLAAAVWSAA